MPYKHYELPEYPACIDMWDELANEKRPIVVYGMGNGADKLISRFEKYGIRIADFFASDGFVRGHSFHGMRVKSFSEIKSEYSDFVIVLSFASNKSDVIDMLLEINNAYDMYVPDMPIAGTEEYFDRNFYNSHITEILAAYSALSDEASRDAFSAIINYKLSGRMKYLMDAYSSKDEMYDLLDRENIEAVVDAGAYNGDTIIEAKAYFPRLKKVFAIEPDRKNFKKLAKYSEAEKDIFISLHNCAAWRENSVGSFFVSGNRNSTAVATASFEHSDEAAEFVKIDSLASEKIDYIKYDVEGAEDEALCGSREVINRDRPMLLVSAYHRSKDIFSLVNKLKQEHPFYDIYMRRLRCIPAWEINIILIPKRIEKNSVMC